MLARATSRGDGRVLPARHARVPDRPHARDRGGARPTRSTSRASRRAWRSSGTRAKEAHKAAGGRDAPRRSSCTASCSTRSAPPSSPAARSTRPRRRGARDRRRRRAAGPSRRRAPRSTWCSTARRSTPSPAVRSATPGTIDGTPGVGDGTRVRVLDTQYGLPGLVLHLGAVEEGIDRRGRRGDRARSTATRRDAIRRNHTATHVLHWALREVLGDAREAGGFDVGARPPALRLQPLRSGAAVGSSRRSSRSRTREIISDAPVRHYETTKDHAEQHRRDRVLRRQVRRPRACARGGRALDRAVWRHARARARLHRADQDPERGLDRRQPAPDRGGHRGGRPGAHSARRGRPARGGGCVGGETRRSARPPGAPARRPQVGAPGDRGAAGTRRRG